MKMLVTFTIDIFVHNIIKCLVFVNDSKFAKF